MPVIAEVSWEYHRGAREPVFQVLKSYIYIALIKYNDKSLRALLSITLA
jgi:hypothetical protein